MVFLVAYQPVSFIGQCIGQSLILGYFIRSLEILQFLTNPGDEFISHFIYLDFEYGQLAYANFDCLAYATPHSEGNNCTTCKRWSQPESIPIKLEESVLVFFEEYAWRLKYGYYSVDKFCNQSDHLAILAYPSLVDGHCCSRAVTRGVEAIASAVFLPERGFFVYSVRLRLLTRNDGHEYVTPALRGFDTCQQVSHNWKITKERGQSNGSVDLETHTTVEGTRGEGPYEQFALLEEGGFQVFVRRQDGVIVRPSVLDEELDSDDEEKGNFSDNGKGYFFRQMDIERSSQLIEGVLQFVPGSMLEPKGNTFDVRVAPIALDSNPDFFFIT